MPFVTNYYKKKYPKDKYPFLESRLTLWTWRITTGFFTIVVLYSFIKAPYEMNNKLQNELNAIKATQMELSPEIKLFSHLQNSPPTFTIYNIGPVEAIQLEIDQLFHEYRKDHLSFALSQGDNKFQVSQLSPLPKNKITIPFDKNLIYNIYLKVGEESIQNHIVEIRISYRRPSDKKIFIKRAFFFINPDGHLVQENDISLNKNSRFYQTLLTAVLNINTEKTTNNDMPWDILH